jgi:hypothetical protein
MKLDRIAAIIAAVTIAGFTHSLAAQEKPDVSQAGNVSPPVVSEPEFIVEPALEENNAPAQVMVQTEDRFLSEMKVYPSF